MGRRFDCINRGIVLVERTDPDILIVITELKTPNGIQGECSIWNPAVAEFNQLRCLIPRWFIVAAVTVYSL